MLKKVIVLTVFVLSFCPVFVKMSAAEPVIEPYTYKEDFEERELNGWFSYPIYEDSAYDSGFRINTFVNGDPNISIEQIVTPHFDVDTYCGAQKLLDMYLTPESSIKFRYYLKTHLPAEYLKLRIAAGPDGCLDYTIKNPQTNKWVQFSVGFADIAGQNSAIKGKKAVKVNGIAVLGKIPDADTKMNICFGLDDVILNGSEMVPFRFEQPTVRVFPEWKQRVIKKWYYKGDLFNLKGAWPVNADKVVLDIAPFENPANVILSKKLTNDKNSWSLKPFKLDLKENLYTGILKAYRGNEIVSETEFTIHIAPQNIGKKHPRLWFTDETKSAIKARLDSERFKALKEQIAQQAKNYRQNTPVESLFYDFDQLVADGWTVPWDLWHFRGWNPQNGTDAFYWNSIAYALLGDETAGKYAKDLLLKYTQFPSWNCPFYQNRGQYSSLSYGFLSPKVAVTYDLIYNLMSENERKLARDGIIRNMIDATHITYVENNMIPTSTSNWLAHIFGGDLLCIAAVFEDGESEMMEEYFAGAMIKMNDYIQKSFHEDGSYAEGHGYYNYAMIGTGESLPVVEKLFGTDLSKKVTGSYRELLWNSNIENDWYYSFGCDQSLLHLYLSQGNMAWMAEKAKDPILTWFYKDIMQKGAKTGGYPALIQELLHKTGNLPEKTPFDLNPSRVFPEQGRTVFKSGWGKDDFAFSMTTGPYFNHEDIHMGSFWLADLGSRFIVDYWDGDKYGDPRYYGYKIQPIAHSTILIDHNEVSQRSGDPYNVPEGFDERAFIYQYLDGKNAAFSSGDIGRLYWGKVKEMRRNILYLKPRTILMLDTVIPAEKDADVTLLFQTLFLKDIKPGAVKSEIATDNNVLNISHLYPEKVETKAVERPHFADTFNRAEKYGSPYPTSGPLEREGMLQVTAHTNGAPFVFANLMKAAPKGETVKVETTNGSGFVSGKADGIPFVFSTKPGSIYNCGDISTDALALTDNGGIIFASLCTKLSKNDVLLIESQDPVTCEIGAGLVKCCKSAGGAVAIGVDKKPSYLIINGKKVTKFEYDNGRKTVSMRLEKGESEIQIR